MTSIAFMADATTAKSAATELRLAVGIATRGRPGILAAALNSLGQQTRAPDRVIVCATGPGDVDGADAPLNVQILMSASGLPRQRNAILDAATDCDILLFLDDDFLMAPGYIAATTAVFTAHPDIVVTTGSTIADGAREPGYSFEAASALIAEDPLAGQVRGIEPAAHGYGCNMAIRLQPVWRERLRFDERLPLYGWSEDIDFTHLLGRHGRIVKVLDARGVHLGVKQGRSSGRRLGYSQVANPIYLFGKGSYSLGRATRSVGRNLLANAVKSLQPEPYIDRRGRLHGNGLAFLDLIRGRLAPERILDI